MIVSSLEDDMIILKCFMQFELACDNEWKVTLASTLFMVGMFFGGLTLANVADM